MTQDRRRAQVSRRRLLAGAAAAPALSLATPAIAQGALKGTRLTILAGQWYVPQTNTMLDQLAADLARDSGMEIKVERFAGDELMTKTASVIATGRGADLAVGVEFDTYVYANRLNDVTDLADEVGKTYGGWMDAAKATSVVGGRWKSLPIGQAPATGVTTVSGTGRSIRSSPSLCATSWPWSSWLAAPTRSRPRTGSR